MSAALLHEVEAYLARTGASAWKFGKYAVGNPNFVRELRGGKQCRPITERKVRAAMAVDPTGKASGGSPNRVVANRPRAVEPPTAQADRSVQVPGGIGPAPFVPIARVAEDDGALAHNIKIEARRQGKALSAFLSELVALGWQTLREARREEAA